MVLYLVGRNVSCSRSMRNAKLPVDYRKNIGGYGHRRAIIAVKDNNLISALVSNTWTLGLVGTLFFLGRSDVIHKIWSMSPVLVGVFAFLCIGFYGLSLVFFGRLSSLQPVKLIQIGMLHSGKILAVAILQILQWMSAMPLESMQTWLTFLTVQILLKRIPGLPNVDLVFLGVGLSLAGFAEGANHEVAAMLVAAAAMSQIVHLTVFILTVTLSVQVKK